MSLNECMTVTELHAAEKKGYNLWKLINILNLSNTQLKEIAVIDIVSGDEQYRNTKKTALLPEIRGDKEFDSDFGVWYVLAEIARDISLHHLLKNRNFHDKIYVFLFTACDELACKKMFTPAMYYLIVTRCTHLDSDKVVSSYDIDRHRGKKRAIEWIKNNG